MERSAIDAALPALVLSMGNEMLWQSHRNPLFTAALFTTGQKKWATCPSTDIHKVRIILLRHKELTEPCHSFVATQAESDIITLKVMSQPHKAK